MAERATPSRLPEERGPSRWRDRMTARNPNQTWRFRSTSDYVARFWRLVDERGPEECWEWRGHRLPQGYGTVRARKKVVKAHRVALMLSLGQIVPDNRDVLHRCDNPPCCNPRHLEAGTAEENAKQCVERGRHHIASATHCVNGHPFSGDTFYRKFDRGGWVRLCRVCQRDARRKRAGWKGRTYKTKLNQTLEEERDGAE